MTGHTGTELSGFGYLVFSPVGLSQSFAHLFYLLLKSFPCELNREQLPHSDLTSERILIQRMPTLIATSL
jgi:hypothetical protein